MLRTTENESQPFQKMSPPREVSSSAMRHHDVNSSDVRRDMLKNAINARRHGDVSSRLVTHASGTFYRNTKTFRSK